MANYIDYSLRDPFGSQLLVALDKLSPEQLEFNIKSRIDVIAEQHFQHDYLPLIYFKNRWLTDQLEEKIMQIYQDKQKVTSAVVLTGTQK